MGIILASTFTLFPQGTTGSALMHSTYVLSINTSVRIFPVACCALRILVVSRIDLLYLWICGWF